MSEPETLVLDDMPFDAQTAPVTLEGEVSALDLGNGWADTAYVEIGVRPESTKNERNAGVYLIAFNVGGVETRINLQDYSGNGQSGGVISIDKDSDFSYKMTLTPSGSTGGTATLEVWVNVTYWWEDYAAYSESSLVNISVEIFESGFEPFLNDSHPELNTSQLAYEGFFADTDNDSYYDIVYIFALTDIENIIAQAHEYPVFYDAHGDTYIVDFNENNQVDTEETSSPVPAESIPLCTDGNPYT